LNRKGFTLIEVLIAMAIFVTAFFSIIDSQNMNVRSSARARRMSQATLLAEQKLSEVMLKYDGKSLSEIPEKEEGQFEKQFSSYRWVFSSQDFNYDLSFLVQMMQGEGEEAKEQQQSPILAYLPKISKFIQNSSKEITVTIYWKEGSGERNFTLTTHLFNYKQPVQL